MVKTSGGNFVRAGVSNSWIFVSFKIKMFLSSEFRNEGFMIYIRGKSDNSFMTCFREGQKKVKGSSYFGCFLIFKGAMF